MIRTRIRNYKNVTLITKGSWLALDGKIGKRGVGYRMSVSP